MIIDCLEKFDGIGIWQKYKNKNGIRFAQKTLIYGLNGAGKTTLSRAFSSIAQAEIDEKLPAQTTFQFTLSDGSTISSENLSTALGGNLLVFNSDFVDRNIAWSDGLAVGIAYISEKNIEIKAEYDEFESNYDSKLSDVKEAKGDRQAVEKEVSNFKTATAKQIRELAPSNSYTQSFDARKIDPLYAERDYNSDEILTENDLKRHQSTLLQDSPLDRVEILESPMTSVPGWIEASQETVQQSPTSGISEVLKEHSELVAWVERGYKYHESEKLDECLFCGNTLSSQRLNELEKLFDDTWRLYVAKLEKVRSDGRSLREAVRDFSGRLPDKARFNSAAHEAIEEISDELAERISFTLDLIDIYLNLLDQKSLDLSISKFEIDEKFQVSVFELYQNFEKLIMRFNGEIEKHNNIQNEFQSQQSAAFFSIRNHVLAEKQAERKDLYKRYASLDIDIKKLEDDCSNLLSKRNSLRSQLSDHGLAADKLNDMLRRYLGHGAIQLEAKDDGFRLVRPDGSTAQNLSDGEKTALAFCYFLTLLVAEGRDPKELIVVVDDPISSLDTSAQTHAFSLLARLTKKCRQTIILTHNLPFMNMVKREFQGFSRRYNSNDKAALLMLNCQTVGEDTDSRTTSLELMDNLLVENDSDYHYQFKIVSAAASTGSSAHHFLLPNATRKMLEIFTAFWCPNEPNFTAALMSNHGKIGDKVDIKSLERLVQIESHGSISGMMSPSTLTVEEAISAAKAAIELLKSVAPQHLKSMQKLVNKSNPITT